MDLDKLNKRIEPDLLTGGTQTIYWNDEHTFLMCIPHQGIPINSNAPKLITKWTDNKDGTKTWESKWETPAQDTTYEEIQPKQIENK